MVVIMKCSLPDVAFGLWALHLATTSSNQIMVEKLLFIFVESKAQRRAMDSLFRGHAVDPFFRMAIA